MRSVNDTQPQEEEEVSIKLFLHRSNGHIAKHRVRGRFDWQSVSTFILHVWAGSHLGKPIQVEYTDDEGDVVCVASQAEWAECLRVYRDFISSNGRPLCLTVRRRPNGEDDEWSDEDTVAAPSQLAPRDTVMHFREGQEVGEMAPPQSTADGADVPDAVAEVPSAAVVEEFVHVEHPDAVPVPAPEPTAQPVPTLAPLSPRSEATLKLQSIFPDLSNHEAHFLLQVHGNDIGKVITFKLGA